MLSFLFTPVGVTVGRLETHVAMSEVSTSDSSLAKQGRVPLDIDLNVADERVNEDGISPSSTSQRAPYETDVKHLTSATVPSTSTCSIGRLELDLNRSEEGPEIMRTSTRRLEIPLLSARRSSSGGLSNGEVGTRGFDLNNGPGLDEVIDPTPHFTHAKSYNSHVPSIANTNTDLGSLSPWWYAGGGSYPQITLRSFGAGSAEQPYQIAATSSRVQKILGSASGGPATYNADVYRTPVLSSSPAISFPSANAFPYTNFPFGGPFPLASTSFMTGSSCTETSGVPCFSVVRSQLGGPSAVAVSSPFVRPHVSYPECVSAEASCLWPARGLDLNNAREYRFSVLKQLSISNPLARTGEQLKMYQVAGGAALKRKEPEGGWNSEILGHDK